MVVVNIDLEKLSGRQERDRHPGRELNLTDALAKAKEGDPDALRYLYERYRARVYSYLLRLLRDAHDAEDVTQRVFLRLYAKIALYRPEAPFEAWLLRVARNVALDHLRRRRPEPRDNVVDLRLVSEQAFDDRPRSLRVAFEALPEDQRSVALLRHVHGFTPTEIAEKLGRSESSVHGLHNRARTSLKAKLTALECIPSVAA